MPLIRIILGLLIPLLTFGIASCRSNKSEAGTDVSVALLFVSDTEGMGEAIAQSTGNFTHVAVEICQAGEKAVYEALPRKGVICRTEEDFLQANQDYAIARFRIVTPFDTTLLLQKLAQQLGQPYDEYFLPDNGRVYCSELVYECFFDTVGQHIFESKPMNFAAPDGSMPAYWVHLFDSLGCPIPQGMPGTNPSDMSKSACLEIAK